MHEIKNKQFLRLSLIVTYSNVNLSHFYVSKACQRKLLK